MGEGIEASEMGACDQPESEVKIVQNESSSSLEETFMGFASENEEINDTVVEVKPGPSTNCAENSGSEVEQEDEAHGSSDYVTPDEGPKSLSPTDQSSTRRKSTSLRPGEGPNPPSSADQSCPRRKSTRVRRMKKILTYESDFKPKIKRYGSLGIYCISK